MSMVRSSTSVINNLERYVGLLQESRALEQKNDELKQTIDELKQTIEFLRLPPPDDLHRLFDLPADVVLYASNDTGPGIPAHKAILASRSPVFKAMLLQSELEESRTGIINIQDVSHHVLRCFVHYFYTAEIVSLDMKMMAFQMFTLADKYQVNHLRSNCEDFLVRTLATENALISFAYTSRHNGLRLGEASMTLIMDNFEKVRKQEEYQELVDSDPKLAVKILEAYIDSEKRKKDKGLNQ